MDALTIARSFASVLLDTAAKGTVLLLLACLVVWLCGPFPADRSSGAKLGWLCFCKSLHQLNWKQSTRHR